MGFLNTDSVDNSHYLPTGIGLRKPHYQDILEILPPLGFLEIHSENLFHEGTEDFRIIDEVSSQYPLSFHGVGLSLGSADSISTEHLNSLKSLIDRFNPLFISEHLSWNALAQMHFPDLLPLPFTKEALGIISDHILKTQDHLGRSILIENPSSYIDFCNQDYHESEFLNLLAKQTGCGLLLDINNIFVSSHNLGFCPQSYIDLIEPKYVKEIHLAGFEEKTIDGESLYIDAHNHPVFDKVWALYEKNCKKFSAAATLIEWDRDLPSLTILLNEAKKADFIRQQITENKQKAYAR